MRTIGFRVSPSEVAYVVYDVDSQAVLNADTITIPKAFKTPDSLKYVRNTVLDILREYRIEKAGIRATEPSAQQMNIGRIEIEGVIQEAFASSTLRAYFVGHISSISSKIGIERNEFRPFIDSPVCRLVENWSSFTSIQKEAALCAIGAKNA